MFVVLLFWMDVVGIVFVVVDELGFGFFDVELVFDFDFLLLYVDFVLFLCVLVNVIVNVYWYVFDGLCVIVLMSVFGDCVEICIIDCGDGVLFE